MPDESAILAHRARLHVIARPVRAPGGTSPLGLWRAAAKRAADILIGCLLLLALWPALVLVAAAVKLDSPGPVFHYRRVYGRDRSTFDAYKFRTMVVDGDAVLARDPKLLEEHRRRTKLASDPRVTRLGHLLRRFSIDEFPQLLNVVRGQMSLVGPRILHPSEAENYGPTLDDTLRIRPGMTGLWQVSGRADLGWKERARLDAEYVRRCGVGLDLAILLRTPAAVLRGRGAR